MKNWRIQLVIGWRTQWDDKITDFLAARIKDAREEKGWSQRHLSQIMGRSNAYISQIENRRLNAAVIDLVGFVFAFEKPVKYFLPLDEKQEGELTGEEWELVSNFRKISDDSIRQAAIRQVRELTKLGKKEKEKEKVKA